MNEKSNFFTGFLPTSTIICNKEHDPKAKLTRHHRKPKSITRDDSRRNISHVDRLDHDAWHMLYKELAAPDILIQLRIDLEVYGIAPIPSQLVRSLLEKYANNTTEKIKRTHAWNKLFREMNLREILDVINRLWLDPDYEAILSVRREQTVELITIPKK